MKRFLLLVLLLPTFSNAQANLDSLWGVWNDPSQPDTSRLKSMKDISWDSYLFTQPDSAFYFAQLQYDFAKEKKQKKYMADALNTQGTSFYIQGDYAQAIDYYTKSLKIREEIGNKIGIANSLNNIGLIYKEQGDYAKAINYNTKSLKIQEEIGNKKGIANSLNNIGLIYHYQVDYAQAIDYYTKSLQLQEEIGNKIGIAISLNNIGGIYQEQGDYAKAIDYYSKSLKIQEEIGDKLGISISLNNIGLIYQEQGNYAQATSYSSRALNIAQETGAAIETKVAANALWSSYKQTGNFKDALAMHELYIQTKDSIESEENQKEVIRQEYKYNYEKQAIADSTKAAEEAKVKNALLTAEKVKNKQQQQQAYFLYGGLALALLFGGFIFNRFRVTNKQKGIIETQKHKVDEAYGELEEKNTEIMDSINYAKRIQSAILPPNKLVKEYLPESFILYKPKDIVAGDFYWMEHKEGKVLFAAADCTGHGVPGAMVSVVCNNGLNRSVREYGLTDPAKILDKTREIVISEFEKSEDEVKDGMDIALCSLEGNTLKYAGAHNPLWIIRNGEVLETKANKQPIGKFDKQLPYTTHTFELDKGDSVYIFSDGFVDQFGGEKGKKYKPKAFRNLLLSIQEKTMEEQRMLIDEAFETWRGSLEQIDDVCVIGVKV
jgi:serine phosphatase RsbU (regulator of sigma subunit)